MENNKTIIQATIKKRSPKTAMAITVCCLIFVGLTLFIGLKLGYYTYQLTGTPELSELDINYRPSGEYKAVKWFRLPLYTYDSAHELPRLKDTLLGVKINPYMYVERETWHKGNIAILSLACLILIAAPIIIDLINRKICKDTSLIITDAQASGSYSSFLNKKTLQLPLNKINNLTVTNSFMDKIRGGETLGLATASGVIKMHFISNAEEIISHVTALTSKCNNAEVQTSSSPEQTQAATDKLKELNNLKESGLITNEEFMHKRAEILSKL